MTDDRANVKVPRSFFERHNPRRKRLGLSWPEYIDGQRNALADDLSLAVLDALREAKPADTTWELYLRQIEVEGDE